MSYAKGDLVEIKDDSGAVKSVGRVTDVLSTGEPVVTFVEETDSGGSQTFVRKLQESHLQQALEDTTLQVVVRALPPGVVGQEYVGRGRNGSEGPCGFSYIGGDGTVVTFELTDGALPDGLSMDADGIITGVPSRVTIGETFTVTATQSGHEATLVAGINVFGAQGAEVSETQANYGLNDFVNAGDQELVGAWRTKPPTMAGLGMFIVESIRTLSAGVPTVHVVVEDTNDNGDTINQEIYNDTDINSGVARHQIAIDTDSLAAKWRARVLVTGDGGSSAYVSTRLYFAEGRTE